MVFTTPVAQQHFHWEMSRHNHTNVSHTHTHSLLHILHTCTHTRHTHLVEETQGDDNRLLQVLHVVPTQSGRDDGSGDRAILGRGVRVRKEDGRLVQREPQSQFTGLLVSQSLKQ